VRAKGCISDTLTEIEKPSLSDGVPVVRIAALDRQEDFKSATDDINREIRETKGGYED